VAGVSPARPALILGGLIRDRPANRAARTVRVRLVAAVWGSRRSSSPAGRRAPAIPERYLPLRVSGLRLGKARLAIDVHDGGRELTGLDGTGIELIRAPRPPRGGP